MNFKFRSNDTFSVFVCEGYQVEHGLNEYMDSPKIHEKKVKNCISSGFNLIVFASLQCNLICFSSAGVCGSCSDLCLFLCVFPGKHGMDFPTLLVMICYEVLC